MKTNFTEEYPRIQKATGCTAQIELAQRLGIRQCFISDSRRRNVISYELSMALRCYLNAKQQEAAYINLSSPI